jgi:hypothetical protein
MQATFELIHCFLTSPVWDEEAMRRAKTAWVSTVRSVSKNLDRYTLPSWLRNTCSTCDSPAFQRTSPHSATPTYAYMKKNSTEEQHNNNHSWQGT